jgi:GAF domain-containing protein
MQRFLGMHPLRGGDMIHQVRNGAGHPLPFLRSTEEGCRGRNGMSEEKPSGGGFRQTSETIERLLSTVREALEMDVAFVSEFAGDQLVFRALEGDAESFGWREGEGFLLEESYCKRVLDGRLPNVVPDARSEDLTKDLWVTSEADIGSYAAVPVVLSDGRPYGTLCCVSHKPDPRLRERDLGLMEGVARELSRQLNREGLR